MDAVTRHDVGLAAKNSRRSVFHIHQLVETELALFVVEEKIDVGFIAGFVARGRTEHIELLHTKLARLQRLIAHARGGYVLTAATEGWEIAHSWGRQEGDAIDSVEGRPTPDTDTLNAVLTSIPGGSTVPVGSWSSISRTPSI